MRPRKRARILLDDDDDDDSQKQLNHDNKSSHLLVSGSSPEPRRSSDTSTISQGLDCSQPDDNDHDDDDSDDLDIITISSPQLQSAPDRRKTGLSRLRARRRKSLSDKSESPDSYYEDQDQDDGIDDFVIEDGNSPLAELPDNFSLRNRSGDPEDQFDSIVEQLIYYYVCGKEVYLVDEEVINSCVGQLDRQMGGCCDSLISSVWHADVVHDIKRSPHLTLEYQPNPENWGFCECCQSQRDAITDRLVLVSTTTDKTATACSSSSKVIESLIKHPPLDSSPQGQSIYYVGSTCARRAQLVHTMIHWKRTVAQQVESLVYSCGLYRTFIKEAKVYMEHNDNNNNNNEVMTERKIALAQQIIDNLRFERIIQTELWPNFQSTLDAGVAFLTHNGKLTKDLEAFFKENNNHNSQQQFPIKEHKHLEKSISSNGRITDYFTIKKK